MENLSIAPALPGFAAQLKRLEAAGFGGFVLVRLEDGVAVPGELRALRGDPAT